MYNATVQSYEDTQKQFSITVYTDTLFEAELYLTAWLKEAFDTDNLRLEYLEDLDYMIYIDGVVVAFLTLRLGN